VHEEEILEATGTLLEPIEQWIEIAGVAIDVLGVVIIVGGILWSIGRYLLLGLEILVAADIIKTVALEPNFSSVGVLGLLVIIRTMLSWTLVLEIEGRWPWQPESQAVEVDLSR
jgi:uncharacterized membrane protein